MRTFHFLLFAILLCFNTHITFSAAEFERKEAAAYIDPIIRSLLIFLDDSEAYSYNADEHFRHLGSLTGTALRAINNLVSPILISGSLLYNLLRQPQEYESDAHKRAFNDFYKNFDPSKWIIRKINDAKSQSTGLYCMIPNGYQGISQDSLQQLHAADELTESEYNLGLKIEHMDPIPPQNKQDLRDYFIKQCERETIAVFSNTDYQADDAQATEDDYATGDYFIKNCIKEKKVFVSQSDYSKAKREPVRWIIYLDGHGRYGSHIAQLSFQGFNTLLTFLEKDILTVFFVYFSCYSAGFNAQHIFGELMAQEGAKTLPFPIATNILTDAPATSANLNFSAFIETLLHDPSNYRQAIAHITSSALDSMAQIRLPNVPAWFPVTKINDAVVRITKIDAATRKTPLNISEKPLLLYTNYVPFLINFSSVNPELLIPMIAGPAVHTIDAVTFSTDNAMKKFFNKMKNIEYGTSKLFFIKTVHREGLSAITNLIIDYRPRKKPLFFFTQDGQQQAYIFDDTLFGKTQSYEQGDYMKNYEERLLKNDTPEPITAHVKNIEHMLEKKAQQNIRGGAENQLFDLVRSGDIAEVQNLIRTGIDLDFQNQQRQTALMIAAEKGYKEIVELLLIAGANTDRRNPRNQTAADIARKTGHAEVAVLIKNANNIKLRQIIKLHLLPYLDRSQMNTVRLILEQAAKKTPKALQLIKDIIAQLLDNNEQEAVELVDAAYKGVMRFGGFSIQEFEQAKWQEILTDLMNDTDIAVLLERYTPTLSPQKASEDERKE
ncbi:MAG TPA: ankyrin repeat domain-containing protein [Candidatus Babeliales bacterium]|nr:ankyrin repeat domain-containing protein [Candidatus Babeliales bacterium]